MIMMKVKRVLNEINDWIDRNSNGHSRYDEIAKVLTIGYRGRAMDHGMSKTWRMWDRDIGQYQMRRVKGKGLYLIFDHRSYAMRKVSNEQALRAQRNILALECTLMLEQWWVQCGGRYTRSGMDWQVMSEGDGQGTWVMTNLQSPDKDSENGLSTVMIYLGDEVIEDTEYVKYVRLEEYDLDEIKDIVRMHYGVHRSPTDSLQGP